MSAVFRCITRLVPSNGGSVTTIRFISSKALKDNSKAKPAPWPYKTREYKLWNTIFDKTTKRFDENTKVIVVDGSIASGKSELAKAIASELDMLYFPEANLDMVYQNEYGYDLKQLDHLLPKNVRSYDIKDYCLNPNDPRAAGFQIRMYQTRFSQYIDALAHLLSTGQGVVLDRSCYSDFVFAEAMTNTNYMSRGARSVYYEVKRNTIGELLRPHLAIYLDVPVSEIQKRVAKRNIWYEKSSKIMDENYLNSIEHFYKEKYLPEISIHCETLVYDWSKFGDPEVVVEDIERIDFDKYDKHDKKLADWRLPDEEEWAAVRREYADGKYGLMSYFNVPRFDVPELIVDAEEIHTLREVYNEAPGSKYQKGFNEDAGDKGLLFNFGKYHRETLPMIERVVPQQPKA